MKEQLSIDKSYSDFFREATGNSPYPYQEAFQQRIPSAFNLLAAPTGAGKTETFVCDWLYGRVYTMPGTPTRLAITSPLRTLVEQTYERVNKLINNLKLEDRIAVHLMMGGRVENEWDLDISKEVILIGTQDQIISRQLNRGYCLSRARWPIHFAALNNDCRIVVDETQLQGVGYQTALKLQCLRNQIGCYGQTQIILCSATLDKSPIEKLNRDAELNDEEFIEPETYSVGEDDYQHEKLGQKLRKKKLLDKAKSIWQGKSDPKFIESLKDEVLEHHFPGSLTLVVLNRVESVQKLYRELRNCGQELKLLHSGFRKGDRLKLVKGLTEFTGILISTQCIEAGVDLDAQVLFTELSPWASFVQRCGRAGRNSVQSERDIKIFWLEHQSLENKWSCFPYTPQELRESRQLIESLDNASIESLMAKNLPPQEIQGEVLGKRTFKELFHTQKEKDETDEDVGKYIRESLNNNVFIAWRDFDGAPPAEWKIHEIEVCSVSIGKAKKLEAQGWQYDSSQDIWRPLKLNQIKPGQSILLPCSAGGYSAELGWTGDSKDIPAPIEVDDQRDRDRGDFSSRCTQKISLKKHSKDAANEMAQLLTRLGDIVPQSLREFLIEVAQWHDLGKAHEVFQETIGGNQNNLLAKSPQIGRHRRKGFRHEVASALAALAEGKPFSFAYLVCCHHGKVRTKILNKSFLYKCSDKNWYSKGVLEGDKLPTIDLGSPINQIKPLTLSFDSIPGKYNPGTNWSEQCKQLISHPDLGEFRLAYLETLIRCADAIASSKYR